MTAPVPDPVPEFSEAAVEQLNRALRLYVSTWDGARHDTLRLALERLCTEAHAQQLGPERMLIGVKAAWARVPGVENADRTRVEVAFSRVVGFCIDAYYGSSPSISAPRSNPERQSPSDSLSSSASGSDCHSLG